MKYKYLLFIFCLLKLSIYSQQNQLSFFSTNKSIGDVSFFENNIITFNFVNNTGKTIHFKDFVVESDLDVVFQKKEILPGEDGFFVVKYYSDRIGEFEKKFSISVFEYNEKHNLSINGKILSFGKLNRIQNPTFSALKNNKTLSSEKKLKVIVIDFESKIPVPNIKIKVVDLQLNKNIVFVTDNNGQINENMPQGTYLLECDDTLFSKKVVKTEVDISNNLLSIFISKLSQPKDSILSLNELKLNLKINKLVLKTPNFKKITVPQIKLTTKLLPKIDYYITKPKEIAIDTPLIKKENDTVIIFKKQFGIKPLNIYLLIDISKSMSNNNKIEIVKENLNTLLDSIGTEDKISIFTFNSKINNIVDNVNILKKDFIIDKIKNIVPEGQTLANDAINIVYNKIKNNINKNYLNVLVLATDGIIYKTSKDEKNTNLLVNNFPKENIYLNVMGFDIEGIAYQKMSKLAEIGGGVFININSNKSSQKFELINEMRNIGIVK